MKTNIMKKWLGTLAVAALVTTAAHADDIYSVTIDTSALASGINAPYTFAFQLTKGTTTLGNTATLSAFQLSNISLLGAGQDFSIGGSASGDMSSGIVLNDSASGAFVSEIDQNFAPTAAAPSSVSFLVDLTKQSTGTTPDGFNIFLFDSNAATNGDIPTTAPDGSDSLAEVSLAFAPIGIPASTVSTFQTAGAEGVVTVSIVAVPEPTSWALGVLALGAVIGLRRVVRRVA